MANFGKDQQARLAAELLAVLFMALIVKSADALKIPYLLFPELAALLKRRSPEAVWKMGQRTLETHCNSGYDGGHRCAYRLHNASSWSPPNTTWPRDWHNSVCLTITHSDVRLCGRNRNRWVDTVVPGQFQTSAIYSRTLEASSIPISLNLRLASRCLAVICRSMK